MSGFVRLAEGILFWQVQETESRVSEGIFTEAVFLGISVLVGMGLFLLYDIFRIFRRIVPHGAIWIGVEDFCYWLLCTAAVFLMFLLRGRFHFPYYFTRVILPEALYTIVVTIVLYPLILKVNQKLEEKEKRSAQKFVS